MKAPVRSAIFVASACCFAAGNLISPGLGKCMDIKAEKKDDGTRETLEDMKSSSKPINVQLYKCHDQHNQQFEIVSGTIQSTSLGRCLTATGKDPNSNVELDDCKDGSELQQWDLTEFGYTKLKGTDQCIDVEAAKKDDGTRENWAEIKEHTTVNVHLYNCHDPEKTERVNQLWEWAAVGHAEAHVGVTVEDKWALRGSEIPASSNGVGATVLAVSMAGVMGFVLGGFVVSRVVRRKAAVAEDRAAQMLAEE